MQRSTGPTTLYESVSSIPPDIQNSLLTIAQYGCDPEQVKRWYTLIRYDFGASEMESPVTTQPQDIMAPPKRLSDVATQVRPTTSSNNLVSPQVYQTPVFGQEARSARVMAPGDPKTPPQDIPILPWPTPETGHKDAIGQESWTAAPTPTLLGNYDFSPGLGSGMACFTGGGLLPLSVSGVPSAGVPRTSNVPIPYEFTISNASMPVFVRMPDSSPSMVETDSGKRRPLSPSGTLNSRNRKSTVEPANKRPKVPSKHRTTTEPPNRPRRPSVPYRQSEQFPRNSVIAPKVGLPPHQPLFDPLTMGMLPYNNPAPQAHSELYSVEVLSPRPSQTTEGTAYDPLQDEQKKPVIYQSPYI